MLSRDARNNVKDKHCLKGKKMANKVLISGRDCKDYTKKIKARKPNWKHSNVVSNNPKYFI